MYCYDSPRGVRPQHAWVVAVAVITAIALSFSRSAAAQGGGDGISAAAKVAQWKQTDLRGQDPDSLTP